MKNSFPLRITLAILALATCSIAVQPNYVQTTTYAVGMGANMVTTDYSDGLGRTIQSKLALKPDATSQKDRVTCTFYDDAGRPFITTKPFIDRQNPSSYLPGTVTDPQISNQLKSSNNNDLRAYTETGYWDDPLGRVKFSMVPGSGNSADTARNWSFGVNPQESLPPLAVSSGTCTIVNGHITSIQLTGNSSLLKFFDCLDELFVSGNPFTAPNHILTVSVDRGGKIAEQVTDLFGRTVSTFADPSVNGTTGAAITASSEYDAAGNVLKELPPATGNQLSATEYRYSTTGQLIWKKVPDVDGEYQYTYYDNGALKKVMFLHGSNADHVLQYEYDDLGRQTAILEDIPPNIVSRPVVQYFYDDKAAIPADLFTQLTPNIQSRFANCKGQLVCSIAYNYVNTTIRVAQFYSYNDDGLLQFKVQYVDGTSGMQETWYEYDLHGKVTADYCFYGNVLIKKSYLYDELGRLSKVIHCQTDNNGTVIGEKTVASYTYNDLGDLANKNFNGIAPDYAVTYDHDILDRITSITTPTNYSGFSEAIGCYSKTGNIKNATYAYTFTPGIPADNRQFALTYGYDSLSRLTSVASALQPELFNAKYVYDPIGRFMEKTEGKSALFNYEYYGSTSRLKGTSTTYNVLHQYVFDARGNKFVDFTKNMVTFYDWRNLPTEYRFYNDLQKAAIQKNATTGSYVNWLLNSKVASGEISLVSRVVMVYDADGNRVCKMEVKE